MRIEQLSLHQFRNIPALELEPCPQVNVIYGDNAQGKTNLIEAVWLLTGAKSFRGSKDTELIAFGRESARIRARFWKEGRTQEAQITYGAKKQALLNEIPLSSATGLAGIFCAVVFSPTHLGLIQGGPSARRRFADTCIGQIAPRYISLMADYARTLLQRNTLLKDVSYSADLLDTLDVWDDRLAQLAAVVFRNRDQYIRRLARHATEIYEGISSSRELLEVRYGASGGPEEGVKPEEYGNWYREALRRAREEDLRGGATSVGPHRDDIEFSLNGINVRSFGSQGQQRSCVLALKLAESRLIQELLQDRPVILLDDVMSELDQSRQDYLLNHLSENQVFITCCDKSAFDRLRHGRTFRLQSGALEENEG